MLGQSMKLSPREDREVQPRRSTSWRMIADTVTVGGWTSAVKVAGAFKVILAARMFGAGDAMDAFLIAFLLPSFFIDMLAGPLDAALIPTLIELRGKGEKTAAESLCQSVLGAVGVSFSLAAMASIATSGWFLPLLASSFTPAKLASTQWLLLIMIAVVPLTGLSATWRAVLNSEHRFAYSAAVPLLTPVLSIVAILVAGKQYGVTALAVGTLAGSTLEAIAAGVGAKLAGYAVIIPRIAGVTNALRQVAEQYAPLVAVTLVMTGSAIVDQGMAARLGSGTVAALSYGTRLLGVLIVVGPTAMATAVLPHLSKRALEQPAAVRKTLRTYCLLVFAVILPVTAVLMYLSEPIIRLLFQNGVFSEEATHLVSNVQRASILQLPLAVLLALEIRLTSALKKNALLYQVAGLSLVLTFAFDLLFMRWWGVVGIALAGVAIRLVSTLYLSCKIAILQPSSPGIPSDDRVI